MIRVATALTAAIGLLMLSGTATAAVTRPRADEGVKRPEAAATPEAGKKPAEQPTTAAAAAALPATFTAQKTLLGRILADQKGRTLYSTATPPVTLEAFSVWQPVEVPWLATPTAPFGKTPLPDGRSQWTYNGKALFRHERDHDPQDLRGQGLPGGWTAIVLEPPPKLPSWITVQRVDIGWVFANRDGMTIYAPSRPEQQATAQTCLAECMSKYWRPILAGSGDQPVGRWTIVINTDGQRQWTYSGRPLYTHTRDNKPGEMMGHSFAVGFLIGDGFRVIPVDTQLTAKDS